MMPNKNKGNLRNIINALKWLLGYIPICFLLLYIFLLVVRTLSSLFVIAKIGELIEQISQLGIVNEKNQVFISIIALSFLNIFSGFLMVKIKPEIQEIPMINIKRDMFNKLIDLGIYQYEQTDNGYLFSLFSTSSDRVKRIYEGILPEIFSTFIQTVLSGIIFMALLGKEGAFFFLLMVPSFVIQLEFNKVISRLMKNQIQKKQDFDKNIYHAISAIKETRANQGEDWQRRIIEKSYETYKKTRLHTLNTRYKRGAFFRINIGVSLTVYYAIAIVLLNVGAISVGTFVTCSLYCGSIIFVFNGFVFNITELIPNFNSVYVLKNFLDIKEQEKDGVVAVENLENEILLNNVSFRYSEHDNYVIQDYSLSIKKGEKVLLSGISGKGKTTLLKIIAGFYTPLTGKISWDGTDYKVIDRVELMNKIGFLFQETFLFNSTIFENIRLGNLNASDEEIVNAAKLAGVDDFASELPKGYETEVGERGKQLSGGQRQRIAIARLILKKPEIILIDEATANLDSNNAELIMENLLKLFSDKTIVAISHRENEEVFFDRVITV